MASDIDFVTYAVGQMEGAGNTTYKKMFGEYGIYCNGVFIGDICDNKLFLKITDEGRKYIGEPVEAPPYPGAKNHFLIEDKLEDSEWLCGLVAVTIEELARVKPKGTAGKAK